MLAAINIADELFAEKEGQTVTEREKEQLGKDIAHFQQLWEEAKRSHLQYKEDVKAIQVQKDGLQEKLNEKSIEVDNLIRDAEEKNNIVKRLEKEVENSKEKLRNVSSRSEEGTELIRELEERIKELEGNYFELQMENIQMKGDLEHHRNNP